MLLPKFSEVVTKVAKAAEMSAADAALFNACLAAK